MIVVVWPTSHCDVTQPGGDVIMYKFQEDIRRDREMRDKRSKEEEFLRSSLRGSEKMKRLEHKPAPTGFVNNGYDAHAHDAEHVTAPAGIGEFTALTTCHSPSFHPLVLYLKTAKQYRLCEMCLVLFSALGSVSCLFGLWWYLFSVVCFAGWISVPSVCGFVSPVVVILSGRCALHSV